MPSNSHRDSSSSTPIIKGLLRTALNTLADSRSSSRDHSRSRDRGYSPEPSYPHPQRSYTQPEPRRHGAGDPYTGVPSHTAYPEHHASGAAGGNRDAIYELLRKAAYELGKIVGDVEEKVGHGSSARHSNPQFHTDDERFEELSDTEYPSERERRKSRKSRKHRSRSADVPTGNHHSGGSADEYYMSGAGNAPPAGYPSGQQFHADYYNSHHNNVSPDERPKPRRSATSASRVARAGDQILRNLPELLSKGAALLSMMERQQSRSGKKSGNYSALVTALGLVMELWKQFGGELGSEKRR